MGWLGAAFFGALPYVFLGTSLIDGLFESMSAFTTTGSSILTESNAQGYWIINSTLANSSLAHQLELSIRSLTANSTLLQISSSPDKTYMGLLFWRSFAQWLGGMGIILLFVAILPRLGVAGRQLYRAEVPGPDKDALTPRIKQTARVLWVVYILMTVAEIVLLYLAKMPLFDSLCNTFASMATGGFSPQALSIAAYKSWIIDAIITLFMFLAGANFALHYKMLNSDRKALFKDAEFRFYSLIVAGGNSHYHSLGRPGGRHHPQDPAGRLPGGLRHDHHRLCHDGLRPVDGSGQIHSDAAHAHRRMCRIHRRSH